MIQNEKKRKAKMLCLEYKQQKSCIICGYDKCPYVLQFHHRDRKDKNFLISKRLLSKFDDIKSELDKCGVLCPTCHFELEYEYNQKIKEIITEKYEQCNDQSDVKKNDTTDVI